MDLESSINIDSNVFNFSSLGITRTSRLEQYAEGHREGKEIDRNKSGARNKHFHKTRFDSL